VPTGLSLSCVPTGSNVDCDWSGATPAGFAKFLLLRGNGGAKGRVPFSSSSSAVSHFDDAALQPGTYTYVLVAVDANNKPLVHSNMVPITMTGA
jgi:hypothetical protein